NGFFVSDRASPLLFGDLPRAGVAYPATLSAGVEQIVARDGAVTDAELARFVDVPSAEISSARASGAGMENPIVALSRILAATRVNHHIARDLYDRTRPDLMALYLGRARTPVEGPREGFDLRRRADRSRPARSAGGPADDRETGDRCVRRTSPPSPEGRFLDGDRPARGRGVDHRGAGERIREEAQGPRIPDGSGEPAGRTGRGRPARDDRRRLEQPRGLPARDRGRRDRRRAR